MKQVFSKEWKSFLVFLAVAVGQVFAIPEGRARNLTAIKDKENVQDIMRYSKAAEMKNFMIESVDPCENFYSFACGSWNRINPANTYEHVTTGIFEILSTAFNRKLLKLLDGYEKPANESETDKKVYDFYESCTRVRKIDNNYIGKLKDLIKEFGEMPALVGSSWNEDNFDWLEVISNTLHKYGQDIILGLEVLPDFNENTKNIVYMGHPEFLLETRGMYLESVTEIYRQSYLVKIKDDLEKYLKIKKDIAEQTAYEILQFEIALARGMVDEKDGHEISDLSILTKVDKLQNKYAPYIDVKKMINIVFNEPNVTEIYEYIEKYQKNLVKVLKRTPKAQVANYIFYTLLSDFTLKPHKNDKKHKATCLEKTKKYFAKNLDNMIYRMIYTTETEKDIKLIWTELKDTFKDQLNSDELSWISERTRTEALAKLRAMKLEINSYADEDLDKEFADLYIDPSDYIGNLKNIMQFASRKNQEELYKPPKKLENGELLSYTPANIILENTIKIPVALLQPYYLWGPIYPNALKFGTLATLIGHELIHGFDDSGRKFDEYGNSNDWWDEESTSRFIKKTECFSEQYSHYTYAGRFLPKSAAQSENIADNGGLRLAYAAYLKWYNNATMNGEDLSFETLPTTDYSSKQLFFISYAQVWCNAVHPQIQNLQTSTDQHVPGKYRVIGPLSNFEEFSKEFNCPPGSKMNPYTKCKIY